ncbi:MAG: hypothetical protein J6I79_09735 [Paludibacteraceae bacterium]|nr:hypothetical protein [Paludibacteraceae bacterium]
MHRKILCLFFFTGVLLTAQAAVSYMTIEKTNGEKFSFLLAETPVITFVGDDLVVNGSSETSYAVTDVKNYHFTETDQTVVEKQTSELLRFVVLDEGVVEVQNATPASKVFLISAAGVVLSTTFVSENCSAVVSLPASKGLFVISVGNKSIKLIRK